MTATWDALFDRAADYDVTVAEVREAVAAARDATAAAETDPETDG